MTSLKNIAKQIGVSPSTVSFVLNGKAKQMRISDDLANKILETANREGYEPNHVAVGLRTGQTKTIGLIIEDISNSFFSSLAKTIEEEAKIHDYKVVYCSTDNNVVKGKDLLQMLYKQRVDGYLITPAPGMEVEIKKLVAQKKPVVLMDRYFSDSEVPCVLVDNFSGMQLGVTHLLDKGYKSIGLVTVDLSLITMLQREEAFIDTLRQHDMAVGKEMILRLRYNIERKEAVETIKVFIKENAGLDALVFTTNYLGIYGLQSIRDLGLRLPEDLGMICFDDHDIFDFYNPGITVIQQPIEEIAKTAMNILLEQFNSAGKINKKQFFLAAKMLVREST